MTSKVIFLSERYDTKLWPIYSYLTELHAIAIAASRGTIRDHIEKMSKEPVLVAQRRKPINTANDLPTSTAGWMSDDRDLEYALLKADQIVIIDDTNTYNLFGDSLSTAPEDDLLESEIFFLFC